MEEEITQEEREEEKNIVVLTGLMLVSVNVFWFILIFL